MQFSDSPSQMRHDAHTIFARAKKRGELWVTGTEAGQAVLRDILHDAANKHGFIFYVRGDCWIAVMRADIVGGTLKHDYEQFLKSSDGVGRHTDRGVVWVSWVSVTLEGRVTVGTSHYLTKGRRSGDPNYDENNEMTQGVGEWAQEHGKGKALVFYAGDQNVVDRVADTFRGEDLTSLWDELGKWENTGHGNIDVIATYNKDKRVTAASIDALKDSDFKLHADHYRVEGTIEVLID
jgi:hypothetical protein